MIEEGTSQKALIRCIVFAAVTITLMPGWFLLTAPGTETATAAAVIIVVVLILLAVVFAHIPVVRYTVISAIIGMIFLLLSFCLRVPEPLDPVPDESFLRAFLQFVTIPGMFIGWSTCFVFVTIPGLLSASATGFALAVCFGQMLFYLFVGYIIYLLRKLVGTLLHRHS